MIRKENLLLTYASGDTIFQEETFWVYVRSALRNVPEADVVILTHDMPEEIRDDLEDLGIIVSDFPKEEMFHLFRERHLAFWRYLNNHGHKYDYIFVSDCRDVMFQKSPFSWVDDWRERYDDIKGEHTFLERFVVLVSEGFKMQQSGFACIEHFEFERDVELPFLKKDKDRWIINGGTMLGTPRELQNFHFLIWAVTLKSIGRITDQATLNWLLYYLDKDEGYSISHPQHDHLCLTGEGVKEGGVEPILKEGVLYNPKSNKPYCVIHQWDRLEHLEEDILAQYGS
jgi:hypothetical protein